MFFKIFLVVVGLMVGGIFIIIGFVVYVFDYVIFNLVGFFYGIFLVLGGLVFKVVELKFILFS